MAHFSLRGKFLLASPNLYDPNFRHSVVFLLEHDVRGAFGFVVNMISQNQLFRGKLIPFTGGPVAKQDLFILHTCASSPVAGKEILPGYFLTNAEEVYDDVISEGSSLKIFFGYSGWGPGQLEAEMQTGSWFILPGDEELVFSGPAEETPEEFTLNLWKEAFRRKGGLYEWYSRFVKDPAFN
ncbi:MAG: YqgE/AlgH family protein [Leptospiraceae bacterium]|nr:YqgE/AlgH family protein [Leptospiraceae bacterium]MDW8306866.1 YqgE/AlgH family protein [Leptospiraceae bacterium]